MAVVPESGIVGVASGGFLSYVEPRLYVCRRPGRSGPLEATSILSPQTRIPEDCFLPDVSSAPWRDMADSRPGLGKLNMSLVG